jgi:antitoxin ParD1/3/4
MNVSLTPQLESLIKDKVASGRYHSASEVIREALRLLEEQDLVRRVRLAELRNDTKIGLDQLDRGQGVTFDKHAIKKIKAEGKKKLQRRRPDSRK